MPKFRKKPVVIEAIQFTDTSGPEIYNWISPHQPVSLRNLNEVRTIVMDTLEGEMTASIGDWVIRGVNGEFYPCKPDIFEKSYEQVEE